MDIEGSEYEVLLATQEETLNNFQLIVIELHGLENISNPMGLEIIGKSLRKLTANHEVVHFHPNNCCGQFRFGSMRFPRVVEVTLVRKDLGITTKDLAQLPHPLDTPNVTTKSDIRVTWPAIRKP